MPKRFLMSTLLITFWVTACSGQLSTPVQQELPPIPPAEPTQETVAVSTLDATLVLKTAGADCLEGEVSLIGSSIAEEYEFTSYEEVII